MSQWFFTSDLHGQSSLYEQLLALVATHQPRVVGIGGDLGPHASGVQGVLDQRLFLQGSMLEFARRLRDASPETELILLMGNDDWAANQDCLDAHHGRLWHALHGRATVLDGHSVAGLSWPLNGPMGSPFGPRWGGFHYGIDILASTGTPIRAVKDGTVAGISCGTGYGICTIIDHGGGVATLYAHMSRKIVTGGRVSAGEVIGLVGCTGFCTGPHLHFEVRINGTPKNPRTYLP